MANNAITASLPVSFVKDNFTMPSFKIEDAVAGVALRKNRAFLWKLYQLPCHTKIVVNPKGSFLFTLRFVVPTARVPF